MSKETAPGEASYWQRRSSFVVRIWWEDEEGRWRGWVQHAGSGQARYVQSWEELRVFIQSFAPPDCTRRGE